MPYPSPRVAQLDAYILDSELVTLLKQSFSSIFQHHNNKQWAYDQHPELWDLALNVIVFKLTTWKSGSSYGMSLQNLKLSNSRTGKTIGYTRRMILLGFIIGDYLYSKLESYLYAAEDTPSFSLLQRIRSFIVRHKDIILLKVTNSLRILNLINFTLFLLNGKYPSLIHRVAGISITPIVTDLLRFNGDNVNFEFQNRQLVWNVMTEFLVFILPLLQLKKLRHMSKKLLLPYKKDVVEKNPYSTLPLAQCAICRAKRDGAVAAGEKKMASLPCTVTNAYITNCGHIYCYICIASAFSAFETSDGSDKCLRCNEKLEWFKKYEDVDTDAIMVEYEEVEEEEEHEEAVEGEDDEQEQEYESEEDNSQSELEEQLEDYDDDDEYDDDDDDDLDGAIEL